MSETIDVRATPLIVDIHVCARCGGNHPQLQFLPLYNAPDDTSHWAECPAVGQPILMLATADSE